MQVLWRKAVKNDFVVRDRIKVRLDDLDAYGFSSESNDDEDSFIVLLDLVPYTIKYRFYDEVVKNLQTIKLKGSEGIYERVDHGYSEH